MVSPRQLKAMPEVYIGLGSNLKQPARQIAAAVARLSAWPGVSDLRCSRLYRTAPWGDEAQPDFVNAVVACRYAGSAPSLLSALLCVEREAGRVRDGRRWGPRVLDLDVLVFGDAVIDTPTLSVPHPRLRERAFVLLPLLELAPDLRWPDGESLAASALTVDRTGVAVVGDTLLAGGCCVRP